MAQRPRLSTGSRGIGKILINEGYKYHFNRQLSECMLWRCWRKDCRSKLKTNNFNRDDGDPGNITVLDGPDEHNHGHDDAVIEAGEFSNTLKNEVRTDPTKPVKRVYDQEISRLHQQGGGDRDIPAFKSVRSAIARIKTKHMPEIPHDIDSVNVAGEWARCWNGRRFLLHHDNDWGILIFGADRNLRALNVSNTLYMDGTFRTAPRPYQQVFTVLGDYHGRVLPLVVALTVNREIAHYRQIIQVLKREVRRASNRRWRPNMIVCDFELALITAVETELPQTNIGGCYFHFNQALWRHVKLLGLVRAYRQDNRLRKIVRKVMSLGFLPVAIVRNNFRLLLNRNSTRRAIRQYPTLDDFLFYVENTYINGQFPIPLWNVYERNMDCRTNNNAEAFHRRWNDQVQVRHPNLWILIRHLKDLQAQTANSIAQMNRGGDPTVRRRKWRNLETRLRRLKREYEDGDRDASNYWRAVSHLIADF
ncbi:uncharacterized protein LOC141909168 [Tubulanus polymorphus]|uniref:uncharacterized protein LOC141909168 n=1 Tax=Tubulanus polymorphus TaxID=672921 RepID=UPI003DA5B907